MNTSASPLGRPLYLQGFTDAAGIPTRDENDQFHALSPTYDDLCFAAGFGLDQTASVEAETCRVLNLMHDFDAT